MSFDDDENIQLTNCPSNFYTNCKNYLTKCYSCKANDKGKYLKYLPIIKSKDLLIHPVSLKKTYNSKTAGIYSNSQKGKQIENKLINDFPLLTRTSNSGATNHDGDAYIKLPNKNLTIEIKTRLKAEKTTVLFPKDIEFKESKQQHIDVIIIYTDKWLNGYCYISSNTWLYLLRYITFISSSGITELDNNNVLHCFVRGSFNKTTHWSLKYAPYKKNNLNSEVSNIDKTVSSIKNKYDIYYIMEFYYFYHMIEIISMEFLKASPTF